ncbi:MAG: MOSC domain-containing protein [Boseongicola sp.]|nr:MOSC domain-containing protein [Boseongicola sp.]NNL18488.1 MOSC domain-containing protein [Boseongicola sp.]
MTPSVSAILRHPLKSIGREALNEVALTEGRWLPFDRKWAVAHERSKLDGGWAKKINFLRGVAAPALMAVEAKLDTATKALTLTHPNLEAVTVHPDLADDADTLIEWLHDLWPIDLPSPTQVYRAEDSNLTDVSGAWISINSTSSLKALSHRSGAELSMHRFRGNIWIDDLQPWAEASWVGHHVRIGDAVLEVKDQITRCKATMANPETGQRDVDVLETLNDLGHQEFGVYAEVIEGGTVALSASVEVL